MKFSGTTRLGCDTVHALFGIAVESVGAGGK
jgi:hypothetical protein